jgi:hypothetical protein
MFIKVAIKKTEQGTERKEGRKEEGEGGRKGEREKEKERKEGYGMMVNLECQLDWTKKCQD